MSQVGIVVNPFSGKDLRRISSSAPNVSNNEKAEKVIRIIRSIRQFDSVDKVLLLPDNYDISNYIAATIRRESQRPHIEILSLIPQSDPADTISGVAELVRRGVDCIIALGGDGTCRLCASVCDDTPLIPISTGTNNVYPEFWEGTTVGVAAAYIATKGPDAACCNRSKMITVFVNGEEKEVALVDAAITHTPYIGSKIVPDVKDISAVVVCKCAPELIGLSALIGCSEICDDEDDFGIAMSMEGGNFVARASLNPGETSMIRHQPPQRLSFKQRWEIKADYNGTIALDGERTLVFRAGDRIEFSVDRTGPYKVDIRRTLRKAVREGFLELPCE